MLCRIDHIRRRTSSLAVPRSPLQPGATLGPRKTPDQCHPYPAKKPAVPHASSCIALSAGGFSLRNHNDTTGGTGVSPVCRAQSRAAGPPRQRPSGGIAESADGGLSSIDGDPVADGADARPRNRRDPLHQRDIGGKVMAPRSKPARLGRRPGNGGVTGPQAGGRPDRIEPDRAARAGVPQEQRDGSPKERPGASARAA